MTEDEVDDNDNEQEKDHKEINKRQKRIKRKTYSRSDSSNINKPINKPSIQHLYGALTRLSPGERGKCYRCSQVCMLCSRPPPVLQQHPRGLQVCLSTPPNMTFALVHFHQLHLHFFFTFVVFFCMTFATIFFFLPLSLCLTGCIMILTQFIIIISLFFLFFLTMRFLLFTFLQLFFIYF